VPFHWAGRDLSNFLNLENVKSEKNFEFLGVNFSQISQFWPITPQDLDLEQIQEHLIIATFGALQLCKIMLLSPINRLGDMGQIRWPKLAKFAKNGHFSQFLAHNFF
jgi:hypothetical protein